MVERARQEGLEWVSCRHRRGKAQQKTAEKEKRGKERLIESTEQKTKEKTGMDGGVVKAGGTTPSSKRHRPHTRAGEIERKPAVKKGRAHTQGGQARRRENLRKGHTERKAAEPDKHQHSHPTCSAFRAGPSQSASTRSCSPSSRYRTRFALPPPLPPPDPSPAPPPPSPFPAEEPLDLILDRPPFLPELPVAATVAAPSC